MRRKWLFVTNRILKKWIALTQFNFIFLPFSTFSNELGRTHEFRVRTDKSFRFQVIDLVHTHTFVIQEIRCLFILLLFRFNDFWNSNDKTSSLTQKCQFVFKLISWIFVNNQLIESTKAKRKTKSKTIWSINHAVFTVRSPSNLEKHWLEKKEATTNWKRKRREEKTEKNVKCCCTDWENVFAFASVDTSTEWSTLFVHFKL